MASTSKTTEACINLAILSDSKLIDFLACRNLGDVVIKVIVKYRYAQCHIFEREVHLEIKIVRLLLAEIAVSISQAEVAKWMTQPSMSASPKFE